MVISNPLARSYLWVVMTWFLIGLCVLAWQYPSLVFSVDGIKLIIGYTLGSTQLLFFGICAGATSVFIWALQSHLSTKQGLNSTELRGMTSTLGEVPLPRKSLPQLTNIPEKLILSTEYGSQILVTLKMMYEKHPAHAKLLEGVLKIYGSFPNLPASHIEGGHGGKSLLDHSIRVAYFALEFARSHDYSGLVTKFISAQPRNIDYRFDCEDPLIPIIGLAHDIGKLSTYIVEEGQITRSKPHHDLIGARLLALMDEVHGLPVADRSSLLRAIAHYHHPSDYPVDQSGRIDDDRTVALMMLLIKADKAAGKHEGALSLDQKSYVEYLKLRAKMGEELDDEQTEMVKEWTKNPVNTEAFPEDLLDESVVLKTTVKLLKEDGRIARTHKVNMQKLIGQLNLSIYPGWYWDLLEEKTHITAEHTAQALATMQRRILVKEESIRTALAKELGLMHPTKLADGRYRITVIMLRALHSAGLLDNSWENGQMSPESSLFNVSLLSSKTRQNMANWAYCIVLKPENELAQFAEGDVHPSQYAVNRPVWKDRKIKLTDETQDLIVEYAEELPVNESDHQVIDEQGNFNEIPQ